MTRIRANRESIDDRFSVLGFTVNADQPLYEVALATEPDLLRPENRSRRTAGNFYASPLQSARPRSDAVYMVPPPVVARFVGQPRLYFGVATYADNDRGKPVSVRRPDAGTMYVSLRGLTERGLRRGVRTAHGGGGGGYGAPAPAPAWGGDSIAEPPAAATAPAQGGNGTGVAAPSAPYNDGYSDELWRQQPPAAAPAATDPAPPAPAATAQSFRPGGNGRAQVRNGHAPLRGTARNGDYDDGFGPMHAARAPARTPAAASPQSRAMTVVSSYYNPSDWVDALRTQAGFFASSVQWWAGVENTTMMPHSAICQARRVDGSAEGGQHGSAFFIAPNLLLTAAHVVDGQSTLIIVPGKNGAGSGSGSEPFGRFRVTSADMAMHPSYVTSSRDFDLALIRVPAANASPNYFDLVEELTQSRPEGVVVSGYAAYSDPQGLIDSFVNATIDADKQHMHGGHIRSLPSEETFDYDLQSLGGTSGSPVYYIENGDAPRTHMVGVHVAGATETTNLGCRITPAKLAWIRSQAAAWSQSLSFSLGARALSGAPVDDAGSDDVETYGQVTEPVEAEFAEAQALRSSALTAPAPDYPGATRFVPAHARNFRAGRRAGSVVDRIVIHITAGGPRIDGTIAWFQDGERRNPETGKQAGPSSAHYIVGRDGEVVQMVRNADTAYHASSANSRSIGIEHNANKPYRLNRRDLPPTMEQYQASAHLVAWLAAQYGLPLDRTHIVGHIEATPGDNHDCPSSYWDWDTYMQCVQLAADALASASSTGAAPATSQAMRGRAPVRAAGAAPAHFTWPRTVAEPGYWAKAFIAEFNKRVDDGAQGAPAPDPGQSSTVEDADARARARTRRDILEPMARDLQPSGDSASIQRDLLALATAAAAQVLELVADHLPATPYAPFTTDPNEVLPAPPASITVPAALPWLSRRVGTFLAWIDAATQMANADVASRVAARRQQWDEMNSMIGAGGTLVGLVPGLGDAVTVVGLVVQGVMQGATPDFDRLRRDHSSGMASFRSAYRDVASSLLRGLVLARYPGVQVVDFPLQPTLENLIEEHSAHVLRGWQDELRFLGVGLDTIAQSLARRPGAAHARGAAYSPVRAQELITPYYDPSNPASALQCTSDAFSQQREEWYVGVEDTSAFPHSAICFLRMTAPDGKAYTGTGFYIGRNRILTCAHNLHGMSSVQIVPGRNGAGSAPFGEATIDDTQWRITRYAGDGDRDNDLAVIDNAPIEAPNGAFFRFLNATPGGSMPLAVCGYSSGSNLHRNLGAVADRNKQHLHGGHAQGQATPDTIDYDILAVAGASGSPVYTVRDEGNGLEAFVCAVHVTRGPIDPGTGGTSVNRGCFLTPAKIDWIEGRATTFAYRGPGGLAADDVEHRVALVPQPDKKACWAASMAMLASFRGDASFDPEAFVREAGGSLSTSYGWDQLDRVRERYGFRPIEQPSNASVYHSPAQWAQWLRDFGPLWVVIVGAPHAVVVSGIRRLDDATATEVYVLNPWDTGTTFDSDPVVFNPPNRGKEGWMPFEAFAADFGNMAQPDYGNWRVLHLPAARAQSRSQGVRGPYRLAPPPPRVASLSDGAPEPIEPTRVPGTRMSVVRGSAGGSRWALDQLEGRKRPQAPAATAPQPTDVVIDLGEWPALLGQSAPLPLTVRFRNEADGSVGDVAIVAGAPTQAGYGVEVVARIEDSADVDGVAALNVGIDVRFTGLAQGAPVARIDLRLFGNGRYERSNRWTDTSLAA